VVRASHKRTNEEGRAAPHHRSGQDNDLDEPLVLGGEASAPGSFSGVGGGVSSLLGIGGTQHAPGAAAPPAPLPAAPHPETPDGRSLSHELDPTASASHTPADPPSSTSGWALSPAAPGLAAPPRAPPRARQGPHTSPTPSRPSVSTAKMLN